MRTFQHRSITDAASGSRCRKARFGASVTHFVSLECHAVPENIRA
jgi:hypothetical protein